MDFSLLPISHLISSAYFKRVKEKNKSPHDESKSFPYMFARAD